MKKTYLNPMAEFEMFEFEDVMRVSNYDANDGANIDVGGSLMPSDLTGGRSL